MKQRIADQVTDKIYKFVRERGYHPSMIVLNKDDYYQLKVEMSVYMLTYNPTDEDEDDVDRYMRLDISIQDVKEIEVKDV